MKLVWTERAIAHLIAIHDYITAENPTAAKKVAAQILEAVEREERHT